MYVSGLLTLTPACPGEETVPAKKTKTLVSQTQVRQVGHTSNRCTAARKTAC